MQPKLSVVIPSYNQAAYLEDTLKSVFAQGYPNLEVIVVDGGSDDGSVEIIKRYASKLAWWVSEPDNGQTHAINKGFARATGEILAWLNSDDLFLPGAISTAVNRLVASENADVVYGQRMLINEKGEDIGQWVVSEAHSYVLAYADFIPQETLFWKRSLWEKVGSALNEDYKFAMDWELLLRFKACGARFQKIDRFMGAFRFHPAQKTVAQIGESGFKEMEKLRVAYAKTPGKSRYNARAMTLTLIRFMLTSRLKELFFRH
ncbi:glycosyltransferase family 2 protein [Alteromonas halophila]|uniref:Glycosyltransferase 2-like domain-containing protein n=1 Tax=Alteromonas halophila TaxID=516698 RepID=A0A918MYK9_9ALTE|nr:glycosyltransferase family 2 protein [Alteromonas halophila]GGW82283.1 hypothetical protein GCM10007391_14140 [Alteromonas halophila]